MTTLQALVLGLVQGLAEFLPISSSAHLTLVPWVLGWPLPDLTFSTVLHVGTLVAAVAYFWGDIWRILGAWWKSVRTRTIETPDARLAWLLILATIPAVLAGVLLEDLVEDLLGTPAVMGAFLLVTGVLLFVSDRLGRRQRDLSALTVVDAAAIGVAQACAIIPGLSRSGLTISTGLFRGLTREEAVRFSFLLALPVTAGAAGYQVLKALRAGLGGVEWTPMVLGAAVALVSGYLAVRLIMGYVRSHSLRPFAVYCWLAGTAVLVLACVR